MSAYEMYVKHQKRNILLFAAFLVIFVGYQVHEYFEKKLVTKACAMYGGFDTKGRIYTEGFILDPEAFGHSRITITQVSHWLLERGLSFIEVPSEKVNHWWVNFAAGDASNYVRFSVVTPEERRQNSLVDCAVQEYEERSYKHIRDRLAALLPSPGSCIHAENVSEPKGMYEIRRVHPKQKVGWIYDISWARYEIRDISLDMTHSYLQGFIHCLKGTYGGSHTGGGCSGGETGRVNCPFGSTIESGVVFSKQLKELRYGVFTPKELARLPRPPGPAN